MFFFRDMAVDDDTTTTTTSSVVVVQNIALDVQLNVDADALVRAQSIRLKREKVSQLQKSIAQVCFLFSHKLSYFLFPHFVVFSCLLNTNDC